MRESGSGEVDGPGDCRLPVDAVGREAGYSQLARVPYASMAPASAPDLHRCVFRGGFVPNNGGSIGQLDKRRGTHRRMRHAGEADFLKRS